MIYILARDFRTATEWRMSMGLRRELCYHISATHYATGLGYSTEDEFIVVGNWWETRTAMDTYLAISFAFKRDTGRELEEFLFHSKQTFDVNDDE